MSEWDGIEGFAGWEAKLKSLIDEGKAIAGGELAKRRALADRLVEFVERSRPNTDQILALDDIAGKAALGLLKQNIDEQIADITARSAELAALRKAFEAAAEKAKADARSIRLEKVKELAEGLTAVANNLRGFRDVLTDGSDQDLAAAIEKGIKSVQDLRKLVETKGAPAAG